MSCKVGLPFGNPLLLRGLLRLLRALYTPENSSRPALKPALSLPDCGTQNERCNEVGRAGNIVCRRLSIPYAPDQSPPPFNKDYA